MAPAANGGLPASKPVICKKTHRAQRPSRKHRRALGAEAQARRAPRSALGLSGLYASALRPQQTQGAGPWARGADLHCTEPELRFAAGPALGLPFQAPGHPGPVAKRLRLQASTARHAGMQTDTSGAGPAAPHASIRPSPSPPHTRPSSPLAAAAPSTSPPLLPQLLHPILYSNAPPTSSSSHCYLQLHCVPQVLRQVQASQRCEAKCTYASYQEAGSNQGTRCPPTAEHCSTSLQG